MFYMIIRSYSELVSSENKSPIIKLEPQSIKNIEDLNNHLLVSCQSLCVREVLFLMSHREKKAHLRIYCSESECFKKCFARNAPNLYYNSIIPQKYSWGQLSITQEACQKILSWHHVFVSFLDVIDSFGFKKSANDDILRRHSYHGYLSTGLNPRQPYLYGISVPSQLSYSRLIPISELCYIVQYVDKNGRDRGDPWSLRQTGVYEQVDIETGKSVWIILQPSSSARQCLEQGLQTLDQDTYGRNTSDPMLLHSIFLLATADNGSSISSISIRKQTKW